MKIEEKIKASVVYRMPNESDFFSLTSESDFVERQDETSGFFISNFDSGKVYLIQEPTVQKNNWLTPSSSITTSVNGCIKADYLTILENTISKIKTGDFNKIVISRVKSTPKKSTFSLKETFEKLCKKYPTAFVYVLSSERFGTWIGATPELLIKKEENLNHTVALAGTKLENELWTDKEKNEQQIVTDHIVNQLKPFSSEIDVSQPFDVKAGLVHHLKSEIKFQLNDKTQFWKLIDKLHPTPAVCGNPTLLAKEYIKRIEPHSRELYTGFIGPIGINEQNSLFVNLRCMKELKNNLELFVGGGIMKDSIPENEWQETENKAKTLLSIL